MIYYGEFGHQNKLSRGFKRFSSWNEKPLPGYIMTKDNYFRFNSVFIKKSN